MNAAGTEVTRTSPLLQRHDQRVYGNRIDGRDTRTVRPISIRTGVLPRAHGSALFTRGETQALVVATLAGHGVATGAVHPEHCLLSGHAVRVGLSIAGREQERLGS